MQQHHRVKKLVSGNGYTTQAIHHLMLYLPPIFEFEFEFEVSSYTHSLSILSIYKKNCISPPASTALPLDETDSKVSAQTEEDDHAKQDEGTLVDGEGIEAKGPHGGLTIRDGAGSCGCSLGIRACQL